VTNSLDRKLDQLKKNNLHALMAHIVIGYPDLAASEKIILSLAEAGADMIELQIPFTDPLADGPTILKANLEALRSGTKVADCFRFAEKMASRLEEIPLLFMTYINIPFSYGLENFCRDSAEAGLTGLIVPDIPPDEKEEPYHDLCLAHKLHPIYILSPSSTERRIELIGSCASGFVYCTARVGITGARQSQIAGLREFTAGVRKYVKVPLALGFGISSREHVEAVRELAEISIVGSKVIDIYNSGRNEKESLEKISSFVQGLR